MIDGPLSVCGVRLRQDGIDRYNAKLDLSPPYCLSVQVDARSEGIGHHNKWGGHASVYWDDTGARLVELPSQYETAEAAAADLTARLLVVLSACALAMANGAGVDDAIYDREQLAKAWRKRLDDRNAAARGSGDALPVFEMETKR